MPDLRESEDHEPSPNVEQVLTHYALFDTLGAGAMGEIWLARDTGLKRKVAYKRMLPEIAQQKSALARFLREMQITAQLDHPHIVPVYECELNADGSLAYAMKLVKGKTLKDVLNLRKAALIKRCDPGPEYSRNRLIDHFLSVCDAVHFAHSKGVIHRDLKPVNLMIGEFGEVYVMDWGIARRIGSDPEAADDVAGLDQIDAQIDVDETRAGLILGTPRYMSPQQAAGKNKELDGRSDQFALGLILYEILCLKPAFSAPDAVALIKKVLKVEIAPFEATSGDEPIPRELIGIVHKALARKPDMRYASVAELANDIRRWQQGLAVQAAPDSVWQGLIRWIGTHRQATLTAAFLILLLGLLGVSASVYSQQAALARARAHSRYVNDLFGQVAQSAQRIDSHFLSMQGLLDTLAGAAIQSLTHGAPSQEPYYPQHPFEAPDQFHAPLFGAKISLDWPTAGFSPRKSIKNMSSQLPRLLPVRQMLKEVVLRSHTTEPEKLSIAEMQQLIGVTGTPIMWAHVTLAQGLIYMYPGIGYNTPDYDARTRPWYRGTIGTFGTRWGKPYYDPLSGPLLPCTRALYDQHGKLLGVAGIDLRFEYVIGHLLKIPAKGIRRSYLLDAQGQIIIRSRGGAQKSKSLTKGFETPIYPHQALQAAIRAFSRGGSFNDGQQLLHYSRLNTLGWYFVVESDPVDPIHGTAP